MIFRTITDDITGANKSIGLFGKSLNRFKDILYSFQTNGIKNTIFNTPLSNIDTKAIEDYNRAIRSSVPFEQALAIARKTTNSETVSLIESTKGAEVQIESITAAQKASTLSAKAHSAALKAASIAGNMILFAAIAKGIQLAATAIDNYIHRVENARKRTDELFSEFKQMNDTLADHRKTVSNFADRYDELSEGVNLSTNDNVSLSTEEYEEFLGINEQLARSFPELTKGIDENGNSILSLGTNGITAREQLEELLQTEEDLNNFRMAQGLDEAFEGVYTYIEEADNAAESAGLSIEEANKQLQELQDLRNVNIDLTNGQSVLFSGDSNDGVLFDRIELVKEAANDFYSSLGKDRQKQLTKQGIFDVGQLFYIDEDYETGKIKFYSDLTTLSDEEINSLEGEINKTFDDINGYITEKTDELANLNQEQRDKEIAAQNAWSDYLPQLVAGMQSLQSFKDLDDPALQDAAVKIVEGFDYHVGEELNNHDGSWDDFLRERIINPMTALSDEDKKKVTEQLDKLFLIDPNDLSKDNQAKLNELIQIISEMINQDPAELKIALGFEIDEATENKYHEALKEAKRKFNGYGHDDRGFEVNNAVGNTFDDFWNKNIKTEEDLDLWNEVTAGIDDATKAMEAYIVAKKKSNAINSDGVYDSVILQTIDQLNTRLKPAMDSLNSAWNEIFADDGFQLNSIDILSTCDSIKSKLDDMKELGLDVDYSAFENFVRVLSDTESTSDDVDKAFDYLAGSITQAALTGKEDLQTMNAALEDLGISFVVNDDLAAFKELINNTTSLEEAISQAGLTMDDFVIRTADGSIVATDAATAFVEEMVGAENCKQALALLQLQQMLCNENSLNNTDDINACLTLAKAAGVATETLSWLADVSAQYDRAVEIGDTVAQQNLAATMKSIKARINAEIADFEPVSVDISDFGNGADAASQAAKEEVNVLSDLNSEMDKLQLAYKSLCDIKDTYNKYGRITVDQYQELTDLGFNFLANLVDENGQLGLNASAFERLAQAKLEEMQIQMARNAANAINGLKTEAAAVEYLTYATEQNRQAALGAAEAELQWAVAAAKRRGEQQGLAAEQIYQGYQASKQLAGSVDIFFDPSAQEKENAKEDDANKLLDAYNKEKSILEHMLAMDQISKAEYYDGLMKLVHQYFNGDEEHQDQIWDVEEGYHDYLESIKETYNWIEIFLENLARKADALIDKAGKFITWSKKNAMINRAVKATDKQITGQTNAYAYYAEKARKVGLNNAYIDKIQNGTLTMEDMQNESLSDKIEKYQEWYDKMVACEDAVSELYDQERDLLKQKLDNVLEYYNDLDSYMSSIVSKMDSFISLMDDMGKRSSLTDLLEQFAAANELPNGWNYIFKKILTLSYTYGDWSL